METYRKYIINYVRLVMYKSTKLLAISVVAGILMLAANSNAWKANALDLPSLTSADDIGQSLECVIVVVGCDGTGSVGSSGDTIIGSNNGNGNDDNNTNPPTDADCTAAAACFVANLNPTQLSSVKAALGLQIDAPNEAICNVIDDMTAAEVRLAISASGVTTAVADVIINCLIDAGFTNLEA
jgi:hypothetical protein